MKLSIQISVLSLFLSLQSMACLGPHIHEQIAKYNKLKASETKSIEGVVGQATKLYLPAPKPNHQWKVLVNYGKNTIANDEHEQAVTISPVTSVSNSNQVSIQCTPLKKGTHTITALEEDDAGNMIDVKHVELVAKKDK